jgi:membrane protease YdiL (CAAX protease family)
MFITMRLQMYDNTGKMPSPWAQLGLFLRLLGFAFIALVALALLVDRLPKPLSYQTLKMIQMADSILLFGIPAFFYARLTFPQRPMYELGFRPAEKSNFYLLGILLLLFSFPLEGWLGILNRQIPLPHWMVQSQESIDRQLTALLQVKNSFDILLNLLVVAVIPGIVEEMCFRGVLQRILIQLTKKPWLGIFIAAFIFSFLHFEFQGFLPRLFLGILLGAAYWYSGSLWTSILAHCFFNGIQVLALNWYPTAMNNANPSIPALAVLISGVIVVILLAVMRRQSIQTRSAG